MTKRIRIRSVIIIVVAVACILRFTGIPTSYADLKANLSKNIRLGLDLRGGTQLVLL